MKTLQQLGEMGIVHRDVRPDNIMCDLISGGPAVLIDFGFACDATQGKAGLDYSGTISFASDSVRGMEREGKAG